jgi:ribosomal-protein-alanine N-acetyltransferase
MSGFDSLALTTARLRLRPLQPADAPALFAVFSDPRVSRYLSRGAWTEMQQASAQIERDMAALASGQYLRLGLERRSDGMLLGECCLFNRVEGSRRAEIGYALAHAHWGQGYMHEALCEVLAYGFDAMDLNRVEADIDPRNRGSAASLERLGFRPEGLLRERWIVAGEVSDTALYGLLRAEWTARQAPAQCGGTDAGITG